MDEDTVTSMASKETLPWWSAQGHEETLAWWSAQGEDWEPHKHGVAHYNPGPPFAVGNVIHCDVRKHGLQRAFLLKLDHPRYKLRLESGTMGSTSIKESWLALRLASWAGNLKDIALDQDDPFSSIRRQVELGRSKEKQKMGLYGVHGDAQHESLHLVEEAKAFEKAVKADDGEIPIHLWNDQVNAPGIPQEKRDNALIRLLKLGFRLFRKSLLRDCSAYLASAYGADWTRKPRQGKCGERAELDQDQEAITNMLWHSTHTSWFEFNARSRLVHFCFPERYQKEARDGVKTFFEQPGPTTWKAQPIIEDMTVHAKTKEKIGKVIKRRYLLPTDLLVKLFIKYFAVPKGEDDIHLVYDANSNTLNEAVWVPTFWLPTIDLLVRALGLTSWMTDRDVGDMFLDFQLHKDVRPFTGVNLTLLYDRPEDPEPRMAVWDSNLMGFAVSPYNSIKMALVAKEICRGNHLEMGIRCDGKELNPFQWEVISLNLPGTKVYDPHFSWIVKRRKDGRIACDLFTFVDDERVVGPTEELTWQASHVLASKQSYFGIKDLARKARPCSQTTGAWAGAIVHVMDQLGVCVLTSKENRDGKKLDS